MLLGILLVSLACNYSKLLDSFPFPLIIFKAYHFRWVFISKLRIKNGKGSLLVEYNVNKFCIRTVVIYCAAVSFRSRIQVDKQTQFFSILLWLRLVQWFRVQLLFMKNERKSNARPSQSDIRWRISARVFPIFCWTFAPCHLTVDVREFFWKCKFQAARIPYCHRFANQWSLLTPL